MLEQGILKQHVEQRVEHTGGDRRALAAEFRIARGDPQIMFSRLLSILTTSLRKASSNSARVRRSYQRRCRLWSDLARSKVGEALKADVRARLLQGSG